MFKLTHKVTDSNLAWFPLVIQTKARANAQVQQSVLFDEMNMLPALLIVSLEERKF